MLTKMGIAKLEGAGHPDVLKPEAALTVVWQTGTVKA
jgi:hypothetical protein